VPQRGAVPDRSGRRLPPGRRGVDRARHRRRGAGARVGPVRPARGSHRVPALMSRHREFIEDAYARLEATARGEADNLLLELRSGYAVFGDDQHLPGYCLLLCRDRVEHLDDLPYPRRTAFLLDVALLGEAVRAACASADPEFGRVNYEILGNTWPHLHAHIHPRYAWEPDEYRHGPVWLYPPSARPEPPPPEHLVVVRSRIAEALERVSQP